MRYLFKFGGTAAVKVYSPFERTPFFVSNTFKQCRRRYEQKSGCWYLGCLQALIGVLIPPFHEESAIAFPIKRSQRIGNRILEVC